MGNQLGFYIDTNSCVGCKTCEIACKDKFNLSVGPRPRFVREIHGGSWIPDEADSTLFRPEHVYSYNLSMSCGHCENPACVANCPTGAMQKDDDTGIVWSDPDVCIGCGTCAQSCPYDAPQLTDDDDIVHKCNLCRDLPDGETPACVDACPMRALEVGPYDDLVAKYGDLRDMAPLPDSSQTHPHIVIAPHRSLDENAPEGYSITLYREG